MVTLPPRGYFSTIREGVFQPYRTCLAQKLGTPLIGAPSFTNLQQTVLILRIDLSAGYDGIQ
jgi:hypothetical protein